MDTKNISEPNSDDQIESNTSLIDMVDREREREDYLYTVKISPLLTSLQGILCVFGGALFNVQMGILYCWGNFITYSPPNMRFFDGTFQHNIPPDSLLVIVSTSHILTPYIFLPIHPSIVIYSLLLSLLCVQPFL
jgi:hypothetical protein